MEQKQKEKEIVDELLRSGTPSDMRIVGLINDLSLKADYYRQLAKGQVYTRCVCIFPEEWNKDAVEEARATVALEMIADLEKRGYARFEVKEPEGGVEGAVFLGVSVGKKKWNNGYDEAARAALVEALGSGKIKVNAPD